MSGQSLLPRWLVVCLSGLAVAYLGGFVGYLVEAYLSPEVFGEVLGRDFVAYYSASRLGLDGRFSDAFDLEAIHSVQAGLFESRKEQGMSWLYPPTFAILALPLALLPPLPSFLLWNLLGLGLYGVMLWRVLPRWESLLIGLAFSGGFVSLVHGQNSLIITALYGLAFCFLLEGRQGRAGLLVGLLAVKPHLALPLPVALAASRRWKTFLAAAISSLVFTGLVTLLFGRGYWEAFLAEAVPAQAALLNTEAFWPRMASLYASLRLLGIGLESAFLLHFLAAFAALLLLAFVFLRKGLREETLAALLALACLFTPYVVFYDLLLLAPAYLLLLRASLARGQRPGVPEIILYLAVSLVPLLIWARIPIVKEIGVIAPLALFFLALWHVRRNG